jgi:hypothetical protein
MAYIPHGIWVPTHEADSCWGWGLVGWKRMAAIGGRENGGRRKKEEMRKKGAYVVLMTMTTLVLNDGAGSWSEMVQRLSC